MKPPTLLLLSHLTIFVFFGCNSGKTQYSTVQKLQTEPKTDSSDLYTIIKFKADHSYLFPKNYKNTSLTKTDILALDSITNSARLEYNSSLGKKHSLRIKDFKEYRRQFVAVTNIKGQKLVYVNCFRGWQSFEEKWKIEILMVSDGGSNFFNLIINLSNKTCHTLIVNGIS